VCVCVFSFLHLCNACPAAYGGCTTYRAGRFAEEVVRTTNELESVVTIIVANDKQMPRRDPLRPFMEVGSWQQQQQQQQQGDCFTGGPGQPGCLCQPGSLLRPAGLARLHRNLTNAHHQDCLRPLCSQ
jgi:hypothetical protein